MSCPSLMTQVLAGQVLQRSLTTPDVFAAAVCRLVGAVQAAGCPALIAADTDAAMLIGGAAIASRGEVYAAGADDSGALPEKVLVVASTVVSGRGVVTAVDRARSGGANWVGVWIWRALDANDLGTDVYDHLSFDARFVPA